MLPVAVHPIPAGYYCVPSALIALTGADPLSVVVPAIARHSRAQDLLVPPAGVSIPVAEAVLRELGYEPRRYRGDAASGQLSARLFTWAERSQRWPGRALLVTTRGAPSRGEPGHALVVCDGRIFDNHYPAGTAPRDHPYSGDVVDYAALVERRTAP